jgi:hypothetical protein
MHDLPTNLAVSNPFQILTMIVAPAILTNSSSVLSLATGNRFGRTVDRVRALTDKLKDTGKNSTEEQAVFLTQIHINGRRSLLLVRALTAFYIAVGAFACTALISLVGAGFAMVHLNAESMTSFGIALLTGFAGVTSIITGACYLVRETWLALSSIQAEVTLLKNLFPPSETKQIIP